MTLRKYSGCRLFFVFILTVLFVPLNAQTEQPIEAETTSDVPFDVRDKYRRSTPYSSYNNFMRYALAHDYESAANYLNIDGLRIEPSEELTNEEWAHKLFIVLDSLFGKMPTLSKQMEGANLDGLPPNLDWIGDAKIGNTYVDLLMQRIELRDGQQVWLFDSATLEDLPLLYSQYGQDEWERVLDEHLGGFRLLGVELWIWTIFVFAFAICFSIARLIGKILLYVLKLKDEEYNEALKRFITGPFVFLFAIETSQLFFAHISLNATLNHWAEVAPLKILVQAWALSRLFQFAYIYNERRLIRLERKVTVVLMRPAMTVIRISWFIGVVIYILSRAGFNVSTMLAGLGIGGMAIALASQDTLKNIFGSLMILADKPFNVGQFISSNGFIGTVEEIGIRSTKLRLRNGHQVSIPNDTISRAEIENIARRPYIRFQSIITLQANTPPEKLRKAISLVEGLLTDHEGYNERKPPRVHLNNLDETGFKLSISFWYHPPDMKVYRDYCQTFYLSLADAFAENDISFAMPAKVAVPLVATNRK